MAVLSTVSRSRIIERSRNGDAGSLRSNVLSSPLRTSSSPSVIVIVFSVVSKPLTSTGGRERVRGGEGGREGGREGEMLKLYQISQL